MIHIFKTKTAPQKKPDAGHIHDFIYMILPATIKFQTDSYVCGNTYRSCWAIREYPTSTTQQALLQHLGEKDGVTLKIYTRTVNAGEERRLYSNAEKSNKLKRNNTNDIRENVIAEQNLQDVTAVIAATLKNREPLVHCTVYIELMAFSKDELDNLQGVVLAELSRAKINVDRLLMQSIPAINWYRTQILFAPLNYGIKPLAWGTGDLLLTRLPILLYVGTMAGI